MKKAQLWSRRLGVDISVFMHILVARKHCAMAFHQQPPVCLQDFVDGYFNPIFQSSRELDITLVLVFDGHSHPLKQRTNDERTAIYSGHQNQLCVSTKIFIQQERMHFLTQKFIFKNKNECKWLLEAFLWPSYFWRYVILKSKGAVEKKFNKYFNDEIVYAWQSLNCLQF